jgi:radical SAM protein with 4Fe4S-binding SPASM domain
MTSVDFPHYRQTVSHIGLALPQELYVMITTGCNLTCRHCWPQAVLPSAASFITHDDFRTLTDNFLGLGVRRICITGGEPLLHPQWQAMLAYAVHCGALEQVCLQTNGTVFNTENIARLKALPCHKIEIEVSLAGARPETHDALRGRGSFASTVAGLQLLAENGLQSNVTVTFTETRAAIDEFPELLALVEELGLKRLIAGSLVAKGRAGQYPDLKLPRPDQYAALLDRYHHDAGFRERYHRIGNAAAIEWFNNRCHPAGDACRCMRSPYVTAAGDLYPCTMLPLARWCIGDVFRRSFADVIAELSLRWSDIAGLYQRRRIGVVACRSCPGAVHCGGGCLGRVEDVEGDFEGVEDRCELRQAVYAWKETQ